MNTANNLINSTIRIKHWRGYHQWLRSGQCVEFKYGHALLVDFEDGSTKVTVFYSNANGDQDKKTIDLRESATCELGDYQVDILALALSKKDGEFKKCCLVINPISNRKSATHPAHVLH
jgi:hypothetical protein